MKTSLLAVIVLALFTSWGLQAQTTTILHHFAPTAPSYDGTSPDGGLIRGADGNFYGVTNGSNGAAVGGVVYQMTPGGVITILHGFQDGSQAVDGNLPETGLILGNDGNFYGTTDFGGAFNLGTFFRMTPSGTVTLLHSFGQGQDGTFPNKFIQAPDGNFYGTTQTGGTNNNGAIIRFTPAGVETIFHSFTGAENDGRYPHGALTRGSDGNFYGTTSDCAVSYGTAFRFSPAGVFTHLHTFFDGTVFRDGQVPLSPMIEAPDGNFYGVTSGGGDLNAGSDAGGTLYRITAAGDYSIVHSFGTVANEGQKPTSLILGQDGRFYGVTEKGGDSDLGTLFQASTDGGVAIVHSFAGFSQGEGSKPTGNLIQDEDGNFYGTTQGGGADDNGTAYKASVFGDFKVLHSFGELTEVLDGAIPFAGLIWGQDGNFYGTTLGGGAANLGALFQFNSADILTVLHSFSDGSIDHDGSSPAGPLVQGPDGTFYGTTNSGGVYNFGTVFQQTPDGTSSVLYSFGGTANDGKTPNGGLVLAPDGNFYGVTLYGGTSNFGTLFRITPAGAVTIIHHFTGGLSDGRYPQRELTLGSDGDLYGVASGSIGAFGTAFKITTTGTLTNLHVFGDGTVAADGKKPCCGLTLAPDGNFYGMTEGGGSASFGTVFKLTQAGGYQVLHHFRDGTISGDGQPPGGPLVVLADGNLAGTAIQGGVSGNGTVFEITPSGTVTILHDFGDGSLADDGSSPTGALVEDDAGSLYGVCSDGGKNSLGALFRIDKTPQTITFGALSNHLVTDGPFTIGATASSGLQVTYTVISGPATLSSGNLVSLTGATGTVVIAVSQVGDPTFAPAITVQQSFKVSKVPQTISFAAIPDIDASSPAIPLDVSISSGLVPTITVVGPAVLSGGTLIPLQAGVVTVTASQNGNATYAKATPVVRTFTIALAPQTITFAVIPNQLSTSSGITLNATASSSLPVSYSVTGPATLSDGTLFVTGVGKVTVTATQPGGSNFYAAAPPVARSFNVALTPQTITFPAVAGAASGGTAALKATSTSGLAVSYTLVSGPATLAGKVLTFTGSGTVKVTASQAGDATYKAATPVTQSIAVGKKVQSITFPVIGNQPFGALFSPGAKASSGLPITYTVVSGPATISGNKLNFTALGVVKVQGTQVGNSTYAAAPPVTASFTVVKGSQTISFPGVAKQTWPVSTITLAAKASSGLPIAYAVSGVATISGNVLTIKTPGTVNVTARQLGSSLYNAATQVTIQFNVAKTPQTIAFPAIPVHLATDAPFTLAATATSGLPITYTASGPVIISGNKVTITGAGSVKITASQDGTTTIAKALSVAKSFRVDKAPQAITFPAIAAHKVGDVFTLAVTSNSGLPVTLSIASGPATISGNKVTVTGKGNVKIKAVQAGNTKYEPAPSVLSGFAVTL